MLNKSALYFEWCAENVAGNLRAKLYWQGIIFANISFEYYQQVSKIKNLCQLKYTENIKTYIHLLYHTKAKAFH